MEVLHGRGCILKCADSVLRCQGLGVRVGGGIHPGACACPPLRTHARVANGVCAAFGACAAVVLVGPFIAATPNNPVLTIASTMRRKLLIARSFPRK